MTRTIKVIALPRPDAARHIWIEGSVWTFCGRKVTPEMKPVHERATCPKCIQAYKIGK